MTDKNMTKKELSNEIVRLRRRVSELEQSEKERRIKANPMKEIEAQCRASIEMAPCGIGIYNKEGKILSFNKELEKISGYSGEEIPDIQAWLGKIYPDEKVRKSIVKELGIATQKKQTYQAESVITRKDGEKRICQFVSNFSSSEIRMVFIHDITERRQTEEALRESEKRLRTFIEKAADAIVIHDLEGNILLANDLACQFTGYSKEELLTMNVAEIDSEIITKKHRKKYWEKLRLGEYTTIEGIHRRKDGSTFIAEIRLVKIILKEQPMILVFVRDISNRKHAEEQIKKALQEKEILLKEIHHRIKNNLQIIISLLNLQSERVRDKDAHIAFRQSKDRIYLMALVHEQLYQSGEFSSIRIKQYVQSLIDKLKRAYQINDRIIIDSSVSDVVFDIDIAIPCGLILNELITNAIKHAFSGRQDGIIKIVFRELRDKSYELIVQDNGVGCPSNTIKETKSLGLKLVNILAQQISGVVRYSRRNGTKYRILFPVSKKE